MLRLSWLLARAWRLTARRPQGPAILLSTLGAFMLGLSPALAAGMGWLLSPSPNTTSTLNVLSGVAAISANNVWAVGYDEVPNPVCCGGGTISAPLIEHWDGAAWSIIPSPDPNANFGGSLLKGVAAAASNDVWAVGFTTAVETQPLIEHWDGTTWAVVTSPSLQGSLAAVAIVAPDDVWATGLQSVGAPGPAAGTLTEHWNGSTWTVVASPNAGNRQNNLQSVAVVSPTDVWAVGYNSETGRAPFYLTLIEHWDGRSWTIVPSPSGVNGGQLEAVRAVSAGDIWTTGVRLDSTATARPLFAHWNGSAWVTVPSSGGSGSCLGCSAGLAVLSLNDIWAVGTSIAHWDGTMWTVVSGAPLPSATNTRLNSVAGVSPRNVWTVGSASIGSTTSTLVEHFQGGIVPTVMLTGLTLNPSTATAGESVTGTVRLSGPAPSGGAVVALSSSYTVAATVPASVVVPAGARAAHFSVTTADAGFPATITITGNYAGESIGATLVVQPQVVSVTPTS